MSGEQKRVGEDFANRKGSGRVGRIAGIQVRIRSAESPVVVFHNSLGERREARGARSKSQTPAIW